MRKENKRLNLNDEVHSSPSTPVEEEFEKLDMQPEDVQVAEEAEIPEHIDGAEENGDYASEDEAQYSKQVEGVAEPEPGKPSKSSSDASDIDDEYGSREEVENRLLNSHPQPNPSNATSAAVSDSDNPTQPKLGKAKAKRAKKAARQEAEAQAGQEIKCATCNKSFPSKTKLFAHIKDHAQPVPKGKGKVKKR